MVSQAFPDSDLDIAVAAAFGADLTADPSTWTWTDLSSRLLTTSPITISRGVVVGAGTTKTASATVSLQNADGALTPFLMSSPYAPFVDLGTPFRIWARDTPTIVSDTFTRTTSGSWGTADNGAAWITGAAWATDGSGGTLTASARNTAYTAFVYDGHPDVEALFDVSVGSVQTGDVAKVGPQFRYNTSSTARVYAPVEFGLSGAVQIKPRVYTDSNVETVLGTYVLASTYSAGTVIRCRVQVQGSHVRMRAWLASGTEPGTWQIDATQTTILTPRTRTGFYGLVPSTNTTTLPVVFRLDNVTFTQLYSPRLEGYIADVRPTFRPYGGGQTWSAVQIQVGGVGTRLEKREAAAWSPLRRSLQDATVPPYAYWPLEDAQGSLSAASAFPTGTPMTVTGPAVFDFDTGEDDTTKLVAHGSRQLCSVAAGVKMTAPVPQITSTSWTVSAVIQESTPLIGGGITEVRLLEWATPSGTYTRWAFVATMTGHVVRAYNDPAGTVTDVCSFADGGYGIPVPWDVAATQSGGNINVSYGYTNIMQASGSIAGTIGPVTRITVNPDRVNTTASVNPYGIRFIVGHVMVHAIATVGSLPYYYFGPNYFRADTAWIGEAAHRRLARLCAEERIPFTLAGDPDTTGLTQLGAQQEGTFGDLVTAACEAESGGLLVEAGFGYVHIPRTARYNQAVDLTVDMFTYARADGTSPEDVLVPSLDARGPNFWTIQRTGGSTSTFAADAGYRLRRGTIADSKTLDLFADADTGPHAQWRTHLNVDGQAASYPNLTLDFAANPALLGPWLICDIGSRVQRTNQPTIAGIGVIDQVIDGITETLTPRGDGQAPGWTATLDTSPAPVWDVGVWDSATSLWQPSNTVLAAGIDAVVLSFTVNSNGEPWITGAVSFVMQIDLETFTVTNISGSGSAYTFTIGSRSVNGAVASHLANALVTFATPTRWGL